MFCGVFYFNGKRDGLDDSHSELTRRVRRYAHQEVQSLYKDDNYALASVSKTHVPNSEILSLTDLELDKIWFTDITGSHLSNSEEVIKHLRDYEWDAPLDLCGQWVAIKWRKIDSSLKISTDFLGSVWLYIAKTDKGYIFAQDFAALASHSDFSAEIDENNLLVELGLGYNPDNTTIYKNITIAPPGSVIELTEEGVRIRAQNVPLYRGEHHDLTENEKFEFLDREFERIYEKAIANQLAETCISLSAGLDSRYAMALMHAEDQRCPAFTFGIQNSDEVYGATHVASIAGLTPTYFDFTCTSWLAWRRCIEQLGNIGMIQWVGWAEEWLQLLSSNHRFVLIGYLGDALSGKHLVRKFPDRSWLANWQDWSLDSWATSEYLFDDYRAEIGGRIRLKLEKMADTVDPVFPHQLAMHLDIYGRQRRWVSSQPNIISKFIFPKTYFVDKALVDFWTNLPYSDLQGQTLYKNYAKKRFPEFFSRNEGRITLQSRIQHKLVNQINKLMNREQTRRQSYVIERDKVIAQNLTQITNLMEETKSKLGHMIDYSKLHKLTNELRNNKTLSQADAGIILRGINLMILVDN